MNAGFQLTAEVRVNTVTPTLGRLAEFPNTAVMVRAGDHCADVIRGKVITNPTNKNGFPSSGFWVKTAQGIVPEHGNRSVRIPVDNPDHPGAVSYLVNGGTITAGSKKLTIPASGEYYGKPASSFQDLRFGMSKKTGVKFLYRPDPSGDRTNIVIAYWLKDSVSKSPSPELVPAGEDVLKSFAEVIEAEFSAVVKGKA